MAPISTPATALPQEDDPANRPMAMGLNSNVSVHGTQFHVQTEDLWPSSAQIVTHVFGEGGRVIRVARVDYAQHLGKPTLQQLLPKVMKVHHASIVTKLSRQGAEEDTLDTALQSAAGAVPEALPASCDTSVTGTSDNNDEALKPYPSSGIHKTAARTVWDRLVAEAQRERRASGSANEVEGPTIAASAAEHDPPVQEEPASPLRRGWDLAIESRRRDKVSLEPSKTSSCALPDPAAEAYAAGLDQLRKSDKTKAFVCFARAVQLEPHNAQYRASLRHALDWLDWHERVER